MATPPPRSAPAAPAPAVPAPFTAPVAAQRRWLAWLLAVAVTPVLFLASLVVLDQPPAIDPAYRLSTALRLAHDAIELPPRGTSGTRVEIPHGEPAEAGHVLSAWYLVEPTALQRGGDRLALYAPAPQGNLLLHVDRRKVAGYARTSYPPSHHVFPLLLHLPERSLAKPGSELLVHSLRDSTWRWLPEMYLGPAAELEPAAERAWWLKAGVVRIAMLLASCLALLAVGFYALRPTDRAYGWFAAALAFWIAHIMRDHVIDIPVARPLWTALTNVALGVFVYCAIVFVHRYVGRQPRRFERAAAALTVLGGVGLIVLAVLDGWKYYWVAARFWVPLVNLGGVYLVASLVVAARRVPSLDRFALLAAATTTSVIGLRDFLYDIDVLLVGSMFYLGHALALVVLVFGAIVVRRFAHAVGESERLNRELERRVADKSRELEANHARVRELEQEQARRRERERIMREVHDGIGGQLVQGLAVAERSGDAVVLREVFEACLADLRLMVDAVDAGDRDILNLLARFRHRIGRRLDAAGVELEWRVSDLPPSALRAGAAVHVLRILQEAFANALRHSGGTRFTVSTGSEPGGAVWIEVCDDGRGLHGDSRGHGIDGMRARAAQLGGELTVENRDPGCAVRLRLPPASAAAPGAVA